MREIILTQGKVAIVDDEDFEYLSQFKWHAVIVGHNWYANRGIKTLDGYKNQRMQWDILGKNTDHKNGDGLDNRRDNLRICTKAQNNRNQRRVPTELTPYKGAKRKIYRYRIMWEAQIKVNARPVYLGLFGEPEEAALAYNWAALNYFGEFAALNKIRI
ncbi:hypothetical protein ES703_121034 [subsurface metagenome]